jgi:hypothetical protein
MTDKELDKLIARLIDADERAIGEVAALPEPDRVALVARIQARTAEMEAEGETVREATASMRSLLERQGVDLAELDEERAEADKHKIGFPTSFIESNRRHTEDYNRRLGEALAGQ